MTRAAVSVNAVSRSGIVMGPTLDAVIAAADGISFSNTGKEFLYLHNTHSSDVVVTIQTGKTVDGLAVTDRTITLQEEDTEGDTVLIGPFPTADYNQSTGLVYVDVDTDAVINAIVCQLTPVQ